MMALGQVSMTFGTQVLWYGRDCKDAAGADLQNGCLVQLIRSPDSKIDPPDPVTGAPTGNDSACGVTNSVYRGKAEGTHFEGNDWSATKDCYVCVRIWSAGSTAAGRHYWDSKVYHATGVLPIDIDCLGAKTSVHK
jgi:hypothetical protein